MNFLLIYAGRLCLFLRLNLLRCGHCLHRMIFADRIFSLRRCGSIYRRSSLLTIYSACCDFLLFIGLCIYRRRGRNLTELDAKSGIVQRYFQRLVLRGLHIASGRSLSLFHRRGEIRDWLVVLSGQKYLRLIDGDLVGDPQPVQQHFPIRAGQSEPEPLIARLQFDSATGISFQKAQRVKALHPAKLLYGRDRLGQHDSFSGHGLILPS